MPKDIKTLGNNKARACESLGFVHKKRLCQRFDTTSYFCTGGEARTPDTRFWRPVLYQLSYSRKNQFPVSYDRELIILII